MPGVDVHFAFSDSHQDSTESQLRDNPTVTYHVLPKPALVHSKRIKRLFTPYYDVHEIRTMIEAEKILINKIKPDYIIHDFRHTLAISSQLTNVPLITLNDFYWSSLYSDLATPLIVGKIYLFWRKFLPKSIVNLIIKAAEAVHVQPFNTIAREYGLQTFKELRDLFSYGLQNWLYDTPSVLPFENIPKNKLLGPVIWETDIEIPTWLQELAPKSAISINFGSSGDPAVLHKYVEVLKKAHVPLVVITARKTIVRPEPGVYVAEYIPFTKVLEKSRLCICHGGSSIVYQAINVQVPVLGTPSYVAQLYSMFRFAEMGIGIHLPKNEISEKAILLQVNNLLHDTSYQTKLNKARQQITQYQWSDRVVILIEELFK
jgi:UDP:flavonoid glycosyltransferase YjiC (YdhE family)